MEQVLGVTISEIEEDRYSRFRLITWWDQEKISRARVLVVGAGALGNEILKNLALLGFRQIVIVDLDRIELSNLSRTILFRESDIGAFKAEAAAAAVRSLAQVDSVQGIQANVVSSIGLGLFAWADVIIGGLDNREARLWINRAAWKVNRPWIDGAIEGVAGVARVFLPGKPACYECTLGETDWAILEHRMSCNLLTREDTEAGKVATTPTTSSVIAGIQVQEAVKLLHGMPVLAGKGFVFEGLNHTSYVVEYSENPDCQSHYTLTEIRAIPQASSDLTLNQLSARAQQDLKSSDVVLEFSRDVIYRLVCPSCNGIEVLFAALGSVRYQEGACPKDGSMRVVETLHNFTGSQAYGTRTLNTLGLPLYDVFIARSEAREIGYLIAGDAPAILGVAADKEKQS